MAKPKVIIQLYPMLPTESRREREQKRPLARDKDLYHHVLHEWVDIVKAADEMGVWGISTIEHHLHLEGYEVGPIRAFSTRGGPIMSRMRGWALLDTSWRLKIRFAWPRRRRFSTTSPRGSSSVAWARGYQSRWSNVLGQFSDTKATVSAALGGADDVKNRGHF